MSTSTTLLPLLGVSRYVVKTQRDGPENVAEMAVAIVAVKTASKDARSRHDLISEAAYLRAEQRHFEPGHDIEDWEAAESALEQH